MEWSLSSTQAGWIGGIYFAGYVAAVPFLVGLTDVLDARRIYLFGLFCGILGSVGFALFADGFFQRNDFFGSWAGVFPCGAPTCRGPADFSTTDLMKLTGKKVFTVVT